MKGIFIIDHVSLSEDGKLEELIRNLPIEVKLSLTLKGEKYFTATDEDMEELIPYEVTWEGYGEENNETNYSLTPLKTSLIEGVSAYIPNGKLENIEGWIDQFVFRHKTEDRDIVFHFRYNF